MSSVLPDGFNIAEVLNQIILNIAPQDPLEYLDQMYSVNPAVISFVVEKGKEKAQKMNNKKGTKEANIFFTMGDENATRSKISGFFGAILWIEDYLKSKADSLNINNNEIDVFMGVMRKLGLPMISDISSISNKKYSIRNFEAILSSFLLWLSRASLANKARSKTTRSNGEVVNLITAGALNDFTKIPFTSYYIGTIKTNEDLITLAEEFHKELKLNDYMSPEFMRLNEPKFVVASNNAPICSMVGHPLVVQTFGIPDGNGQNIDWVGGFVSSKEFERICLNNNLTTKDIKKYIIQTSEETHKKNLIEGHPIAKFIDKQKILGSSFNLIRERSGLVGSDEIDKNYL